MPKPICIPCQRFFRVERNGFAFLEGMPTTSNAEPGTTEPENWIPYKLWMGDVWRCEGCGSRIISGSGGQPVSIQHESDFKAKVERLNAAQFQVNDC